VTTKPRIQNGGGDRCNECGLSFPIVLCRRVSLHGCRLEESAPTLPTAKKPLMLIKVLGYAQPGRLTTKAPSNTATCFQFKIPHPSYLEGDIRNAGWNIFKLTDSFIHRLRDTGKNVSVLGRTGDRGSTVIKVLCYKSEGRWFDSR
jgi:hypothetical protein